jgi:hypothetical protein
MFRVTHFRTEFIQQGQATIIRKVTMTQFMFMIISLGMGIGVFGVPFWLAPLFLVIGYAAGYPHKGEIVLKRIAAYAAVWIRDLVRAPRIVNIHAEWEHVRVRAEQQPFDGGFAITAVIDE